MTSFENIAVQKTPKRDTTHDFLADRQWLSFISGFAVSKTVPYTIYRIIIATTLAYIQAAAVCACVFEPRKRMIVEAVHFMLVALFTFLCAGLRLVVIDDLDKTRQLLNTGVYLYDDEEDDEELMRMKEGIPSEIRAKANIFIVMFISGAFTNSTLYPISQLVLLDSDHPSQRSVVNPYLPHLFYQPFDTRSPKGMIAGYLIGIAYYFWVYTISCATIWYYISGVVQLKIHFRALNYSLKHIERRALALYIKMKKLPKDRNISVNKLLFNEEFQECLYLCFRANVQHHQAILRLRKTFEPFSGFFALSVTCLASMVYGCLLYLMTQKHPVNVAINLLLVFSAEQFTVIFMCFLGEDVLQESEKIFTRLYRLHWFNYSKRLTQLLRVMMSNTMRPTGVRALLVGVPASLETYGHVVSAMYKVMNIVRQSDLV